MAGAAKGAGANGAVALELKLPDPIAMGAPAACVLRSALGVAVASRPLLNE
jgi:hypothetical protein